jgi:hypothetical protein
MYIDVYIDCMQYFTIKKRVLLSFEITLCQSKIQYEFHIFPIFILKLWNDFRFD